MVETISVETLRERLSGDDSLQVVDVRTRRAFDRSHLPGAMNLPLPELPARVAETDWAEEIVVVCPKGESSLRAARLLEAYEGVADDAVVYNLEAGLQAWEGPLESGDPDTDGTVPSTDRQQSGEAPF